MKKGICYIVGAGEFSHWFSPSPDDLVIAADGGYDSLKKADIRCDLLVGDLDSLESAPQSVETIKHKVEKDETDMHLCYLEGKKRGYDTFKIYGGCGGRDDHTFANYCLLLYIREDGGRAELYSKYGTAAVIKNESAVYVREVGKSISVFAFGAIARGVSIAGLKYEATDATLKPSFPLGVSNSFIGKEASIEVKDGALLIITEN